VPSETALLLDKGHTEAEAAEAAEEADVPEVSALIRALPVILRSLMLALTISEGENPDSELDPTEEMGLRRFKWSPPSTELVEL